MIISSGQMKVLANKNGKKVKLFGEIEVGDIIEVRVNLNVHTTYRVSDSLVTVHNLTKDTKRTDAPIYIHKGLDKLSLEPVKAQDDAEYQRGYQDAYSELQSAYYGNYIEEMFEEEGEEE